MPIASIPMPKGGWNNDPNHHHPNPWCRTDHEVLLRSWKEDIVFWSRLPNLSIFWPHLSSIPFIRPMLPLPTRRWVCGVCCRHQHTTACCIFIEAIVLCLEPVGKGNNVQKTNQVRSTTDGDCLEYRLWSRTKRIVVTIRCQYFWWQNSKFFLFFLLLLIVLWIWDVWRWIVRATPCFVFVKTSPLLSLWSLFWGGVCSGVCHYWIYPHPFSRILILFPHPL